MRPFIIVLIPNPILRISPSSLPLKMHQGDAVRAVVKVHVRTKCHHAECSRSGFIVPTNFFALRRNGENTVLWPWPMTYVRAWNSLGFVRLSRNMLMQNFLELTAAVNDPVSCAQSKNSAENNTVRRYCTQQKNIQSPVLGLAADKIGWNYDHSSNQRYWLLRQCIQSNNQSIEHYTVNQLVNWYTDKYFNRHPSTALKQTQKNLYQLQNICTLCTRRTKLASILHCVSKKRPTLSPKTRVPKRTWPLWINW